jgi:S-formylglutathione hydrolase FrmB
MTPASMKSFRLFILIAILLGALGVYYYRAELIVRTETVQLDSKLVGKILPYQIVLPPGYSLVTSWRKHYPVLYLLHGWSGHYDSWLSKTTLAHHASEHQLIIVMPEGNNGWYTDSATTPSDKYESYVLEELIPDVDSRFRTIRDRSGRGIAGCSMGGYGALKFGLKHPEMFTLAASMSGALDTTKRTDDESIMQTFGDAGSMVRKSNDIERLAREFPAERITQLPYLYLDCGRDDPWLAINSRFADILTERRMTHEYRQVPGGHIWPYWDRQVREVLRVATETMAPAE